MTDLKPGRELDALIAEKVLGWERLVVPWSGPVEGWGSTSHLIPPGAPKVPHTCCEYTSSKGPVVSVLPEFALPRYSIDIAAAWEVVEKLKAKDWLFFTRTLPTGKYKAVFHKEYPNPDEKHGFSAESETVSCAICLAALKAIEGKE